MTTRNAFADLIEAPDVNTKLLAKDGIDAAGYMTVENLLDVPVTATGTTTARALADRFADTINVLDMGASPGATAAVNTAAIQAAINTIHARGGGTVVVPFVGTGIYEISLSSEPDTYFYSGDQPAEPVNTGFSFCLILRAGVMLNLDRGVVIECTDRAHSLVGAMDMDGGGITGGYFKNRWSFGLSGHGHGIMAIISAYGNSNKNMLFSDIEVSHVASYGLSAQYGDYENNRYQNIYVHDTGADAIDHKVRYGTNTKSRGVSFDNIFVQRFGLRTGITQSAGLDIRGPATVSNFQARDFAGAGQANVGIRFSAGTYTAHATYPEYREPSHYSSLTNFYIDGGDPRIADTIGVVTYSSNGPVIANGSVRNCDRGVYSYIVTSVSPNAGTHCKIANVQAEGCAVLGFYSTAPETSFINCHVMGQRDRFSSDQGTLIAGQTVFTPPRKYDIPTVQVYKNDVLLTTPAGYTATDGITVTLVAPVLVTDVIDVVTPTATGFQVAGADNNVLAFCRSRYATTPMVVTGGTAATSLLRVGNMFGTGWLNLEDSATDGPTVRAAGPAANYNVEIQAKGSGTVGIWARGVRVINASNPASSVNWLNVIGSAAGQPVQFSITGSDTNVGLALNGRGAGFIMNRAKSLFVQGAPTAKTDGTLLTAAEILAGIITTDATDNAADNYQLPLGTDFSVAIANLGTND